MAASEATQWHWFKDPFFLQSYDNGGAKHSSKLNPLTINLSQESGGRLPAGIAAVSLQLGVRDSASATSNCWVNLYPTTDSLYVMQNNIGSYNGIGPALPNNTWQNEQGIIPCDANGNITLLCSASGNQTMDIAILIVGYAQVVKKKRCLFCW